MTTPQTNRSILYAVKATYGSSNGSDTLLQCVATPQPGDQNFNANFLSCLRSGTKAMQEDINEFLTAKMEADKQTAKPDSNTNGNKKSKSRDEEEEENYGEEKPEDD